MPKIIAIYRYRFVPMSFASEMLLEEITDADKVEAVKSWCSKHAEDHLAGKHAEKSCRCPEYTYDALDRPRCIKEDINT
jgi:hypothetical protein